MIFRPAESSKKIVEFYRNYLLTTFQTNNDSYNKQLEEQLCKDKTLSTGPYISLNDVFDKGETLRELVNQNILSNDILNFKELHPNRNLYKHQAEAIKKYSKGANLIITTGTGSGKTECFLIPLLNSLLQEKENHTLDSGVRALIVYPMNALVNDQIRRLREIFSDTSKSGITFGRFTGETKEYYNDALKEYIAREGSDPIEGELISREQMRDNPPNILITNYAMLEYLLLRPGDNVFFNFNNATKWKSIVFDEAHTYSGAKGIEVSNLVKRVKARLRRSDIQFILTSATLGNDETNSQIIDFAQALCSTKFTADSIIRAKRIAPPKVQNTIEVNMSFYRELSQKLKDNYDAKSILGFINGSGYCTQLIPDKISEDFFNETIYNLILHDKFYYTIRRALLNQTKSLSELSKELNVEQKDLTDFIAVA